MSRTLGDLFRHNLWANLQLLDACAALEDNYLSASAPGTYGTVRDTLVHMLAAEGRYVSQFPGDRPEPTLNEEGAFPGVPALRDHAVTSGEALVALADTASDDLRLTGNYRGAQFDIPASMMFTQAINHATEHRSHVVSILNQNGIGTPRLDAIAYQMAGAGA